MEREGVKIPKDLDGDQVKWLRDLVDKIHYKAGASSAELYGTLVGTY